MKSHKLWLSVTFLLFTHWTTAAAQSSGVVTGVVYSGDGAPAAGVRVYAFALQARADTANETPMESQATTDASGNYRLELPPGRYYIAAGSVSSPTYYPGTAELAASKVIPVGAGEVTANIDFSTFVPPPRSAVRYAILAPSRSGAVSGSVKYSDGAAAANITVVAYPLTLVPDSGPPITGSIVQTIQSLSPNRVVTNSAGRYEIPNLHPGTYIIVAGYADNPVFYPAAPDENAASRITVTGGNRTDSLDITLRRDEPGTTLKGRVLSSRGQALALVEVVLVYRKSDGRSAYSLPSRYAQRSTVINREGSFEFRDVLPGPYAVEYHVPGATKVSKMVVVEREPIDDLDIRFALEEQ